MLRAIETFSMEQYQPINLSYTLLGTLSSHLGHSGSSHRITVSQNNQKSSLQYFATRSSVCSFARTAHSFACSTLLALLAHSAAFTS